ncbi:MAG: ORF6N domain-containing protein [Bacteroidetes bacterium]|nr:ORF6N domain-containing protein [Bacteroidota bacterium]
MENIDTKSPLPAESIIRKIYWVRGEKVMLDEDLAELYGVEVKRLKEAVRRNLKRFPADFLLALTWEEYHSLRSQYASLKRGQHSKFRPFAFTEQGVAMLSSVLHSDAAILVNIAIIRAFVYIRKILELDSVLRLKIDELEKNVASHNEKIELIFQALKQFMGKKDEPSIPRRRIGIKLR